MAEFFVEFWVCFVEFLRKLKFLRNFLPCGEIFAEFF